MGKPKKTLVGSLPSRRRLGPTREAVERALAMCVFWNQCSPRQAATRARVQGRVLRSAFCRVAEHPLPQWLPAVLHSATRTAMRKLLKGEVVMVCGVQRRLEGDNLVVRDEPFERALADLRVGRAAAD